jgi:hypothetical protein
MKRKNTMQIIGHGIQTKDCQLKNGAFTVMRKSIKSMKKKMN